VPLAQVSPDVTIAYDTFGDPADPPVLLVMGFGAQLIAWHEDLCRMLADRGRYVIRYDNRDCGLSTRYDHHPVDLGAFIAAVSTGDLAAALAMAPYSMRDLAADGIGLLTALGIDRAHVVGASMGGMIAQTMAIAFPERVASLTSMMSSTGEPEVGQSSPEAQQALFAPRPADRAGYVASADRELVWASRRYADVDALRALTAESWDRAYYPAGVPRQLAAMVLAGSRAAELAALNVPTLVIHGLDDTLIDPSGGRRTAELVPGAHLLLVPDMGHDRPRPLWGVLVDAIARHTGPLPSPWVDGAGPSTDVRFVEADPGWPAAFERIAARVRGALGERALLIQHVGSTAVPGLAAKPIVDIDLVVADPDDEPSYVPALQALGFELRVREPWWNGHRLLRGSDPSSHLHVFGPDSPEIARHRRFRDWLRTHPDDLARYAATKREAAAAAAAEGEHSMQYNARKEAVVREIYARALAVPAAADEFAAAGESKQS
jgi:GrpB-like predicted nucleotidyltransferase (UPF0157 family)/pimeloyl-ACP methyl ester carboxylesterase